MIETKYTMNVMSLNHPETTPPHPQPHSVEKLSSAKLAPGAKNVGDHCPIPFHPVRTQGEVCDP